MTTPTSTLPTSANRTETPRRAKTRGLILEAAAECLREEGLAATSAAKIANRCDLSWGVIQYHFGDRAGLLLAVLNRWSEGFHKRLATPPDLPDDPEDRLRALVNAIWAAMGHVDHQVMLDMQLELGRDPRHAEAVRASAQEVRRQLRDLWRDRFPELASEQVDAAERLATLGLQGLAVERATVGRRRAHRSDVDALIAAIAAVLDINEHR